jgi:hypothetical protein
MLADIITGAAAGEPDIEFLQPLTDGGALVVGSPSPGPDVVLMGLTRSGDLPALGTRLLFAFPGAHCLAIAHDGNTAYLYELRPHRAPLGEISSPQALIETIRMVSQGHRGAERGC